eukprot:2372595-Amphidinium_carterae.1
MAARSQNRRRDTVSPLGWLMASQERCLCSGRQRCPAIVPSLARGACLIRENGAPNCGVLSLQCKCVYITGGERGAQ